MIVGLWVEVGDFVEAKEAMRENKDRIDGA